MKQQSNGQIGDSLATLSVLIAFAAITVTSGARTLSPPRNADAYVARKTVPATPARVAFEHDLDSLTAAIDTLEAALRDRDIPRARHDFLRARRAYKHAEALIEFVAPATAAVLNGPLADDDGDAPPRPLGAPAAFARISAALESTQGRDSATIRSLANDTQAMRNAVAALCWGTAYLSVSPADVLGAARREVARVTTLDLAGFDLGATDDALGEAADALDGTRSLMHAASANESMTPAWREAEVALGDAVTALRQPSSFVSFDRLAFIVRFATPASRAIARARAVYASEQAPRRTAWRDASASVFDRDALDASAYAPEYAPAATPALIALGRRLFSDPVLSGPQTRSCATCHVPEKAFADGRAVPASLSTIEESRRNTPTLINAAFQPLLFADERAGSLEEQVGAVLASPAEMHSSATVAASRLQSSASYRAEFRGAFANHSDSITELSLRVALAAYVRSLTALDSRFDRAAQGDTNALSRRERAGFTVFMGKARCGTCHFAPLFNGTMPPSFTTSEPEIILAPRSPLARVAVDKDPGRFSVDHIAQHRFAFKVPTLRNVALTAPYMHNGAFATLEDVVDFYDRGGTPAPQNSPSATLSSDRLQLTGDEKRSLIAFLNALTDTVVAQPYCVAGTCVRRSVAKM